jgi:site-specific recombinase XerD
MACRYRSSDSEIIGMWLERQPSPLTRDCYNRDAGRVLAHAGKPLKALDLGDLQKFAQFLIDEGLAPISRARTIAAVKSLFGFCFRMRFIKSNPSLELRMPKYEVRLAERVLSEGV